MRNQRQLMLDDQVRGERSARRLGDQASSSASRETLEETAEAEKWRGLGRAGQRETVSGCRCASVLFHRLEIN